MKATMRENILPNTGSLDKAEFLYKNWKISDANNSNAKIIGVGGKRGRYKNELLRRICALGNAGGGILFWGLNPDNGRVQGIKFTEEEK